MKESDVEDLASHNGPESWGSARKDGVQALTGARVGWVMSREIRSRVPTTSPGAEGNTGRRVNRECRTDPARSKTPCMHGTSTRENREILGRPMAGKAATGGPGKA